MIQRFCKGVFSLNYKMTIGVDFLERVVRSVLQKVIPLFKTHTRFRWHSVNGVRVHLMLWDTAGQEEFDALTKAYYRVSDGCVLAFSTTDIQSFEAIEKWKKKVEFECGPIPMVLVQNKSDLMEESRVSPQSVERLAKNLNLPVFQTSSKNNLNIDKGECHASLTDHQVSSSSLCVCLMIVILTWLLFPRHLFATHNHCLLFASFSFLGCSMFRLNIDVGVEFVWWIGFRCISIHQTCCRWVTWREKKTVFQLRKENLPPFLLLFSQWEWDGCILEDHLSSDSEREISFVLRVAYLSARIFSSCCSNETREGVKRGCWSHDAVRGNCFHGTTDKLHEFSEVSITDMKRRWWREISMNANRFFVLLLFYSSLLIWTRSSAEIYERFCEEEERKEFQATDHWNFFFIFTILWRVSKAKYDHRCFVIIQE